MPGTKAGGLKAAATNRARHGEGFYKRIAAIGGRNGHTGGFAEDITCDCSLVKGKHVIRQCAGVKGGRISRRGKSVVQAESVEVN